jgi:RNA polymerase sigma-70 factor, ECF subfamily
MASVLQLFTGECIMIMKADRMAFRMMDLEEEKHLVEDAKRDPLAFGELYDAYYLKISNYLLHRLPYAEVAQDITSEVFFKAMTKLHTFSWRNLSFSSWLFKIANNEIKMYYRKKEGKFFSLEFLLDSNHFEPPDSMDIEQDYLVAEEELSRNQKFKEAQAHLAELPLIYQEVLALRFFEKMSLAEIGEITGKNLNTVKSLLSRGTEKLRAQMTKPNGDER